MRTAYSRDIMFYDLDLVADPPDAPLKTMDQIAALVRRLKEDRKAVRISRNGHNKLRVADFDLDEEGGMLWLLLYFTNRHGSDAAYGNMDNDAHRLAGKQEGEGRSEAAHLLISTAPTDETRTRYTALCEECPAIPRVKLEAFLRKLLRLAKQNYPDEFQRPAPSGQLHRDNTPVMKPYFNKLSIAGHMSEVLAEQIQAGRISGITLETHRMIEHGFGEEAYVVPKLASLKLEIAPEARNTGINILGSAFRMARRKNYENARILFAEEGQKTLHSAVLETERGMVISDGYVKRREIKFDGVSIADAFEVFQDPIMLGMRSLLEEHRGN